MQQDQSTRRMVLSAWLIVSGALIAAALCLVYFGDHFAWPRGLENIPALWFTGGLMAAGLIYVLLVPLIRWTLGAPNLGHRSLVAIILIAGLAMRLVMIPANPALEDDFYRYLWDGAVTAHGYNPYKLSPAKARTDAAPPPIRRLAETGMPVLNRTNHPELKTIYPPVAQAMFALAYMIEPWSLRAWRLVCLMGELASVALLLMLLGAVGRSPLWVALYWLNPLVVKELMNSAHMEAILLPFVLGTMVLLIARRPVMAAATLGLAIGAKLWPVMLLPLVLRPLLGEPRRLLAALTILAVMAAAWALPPYLGGFDADSGFVAYAKFWQTNSALFQLLQNGVTAALAGFAVTPELPAGMIVRVAMAAIVGATALWIARHPPRTAEDVVRKAATIAVLLFLLSPAQFPWYASWVLIFAPLLPLAGLVGLTVFMPLYYVTFHLYGVNADDSLNIQVIRAEWLLIAACFLWDGWRFRNRPLAVDLSPKRD